MYVCAVRYKNIVLNSACFFETVAKDNQRVGRLIGCLTACCIFLQGSYIVFGTNPIDWPCGTDQGQGQPIVADTKT